MNSQLTKILYQAIRFFIEYFNTILLTVCVIIVGFSGLYILYPRYRAYIKQRDVVLPAREKQLEVERQKLENVKKNKSEFDLYSQTPQIQKLSQIVPQRQDVADLFVQFDNIAREAEFTLVDLSINEDLSGGFSLNEIRKGKNVSHEALDINKMRIQINLRGGGYNNLKRLLAIMENNLRLMDINSLSFTPGVNSETLYTLSLTTYYIPDN